MATLKCTSCLAQEEQPPHRVLVVLTMGDEGEERHFTMTRDDLRSVRDVVEDAMKKLHDYEEAHPT